jgi:hypothetical protein
MSAPAPLKFDDRMSYSIDTIERSIVADTEAYTKYTAEQKKQLYQEKHRLLDKHPKLKAMVDVNYLYGYPVDGVEKWGKVDICPPELIVSDDRIKDMCTLPFWTDFVVRENKERQWRFTRCPGVEKHSSCPYHSAPAATVREMLADSDLFIFVQTKEFSEFGGVQWQYQTIKRYCDELEQVLGKGAVVQRFGAGPCQHCYPDPCKHDGKCREKKHQVPAMESMGFAMGHLCRDMALITGDASWKLTWIKRWQLETQWPKVWKVHFGVAVKLDGASG